MQVPKKLTKLIIGFILIAISLAGCSNATTSDAQKGDTSSSNNSSQTNNGAAEDNTSSEEVKKVEIPEGIELTWYMRGGSSSGKWPVDTMKCIEELEKRTGINIKFIEVTESQDDQYKMMIASGDYPDLIHWTHHATYPGGVAKLVEDGVAVELNQLIEDYMPNFKKILEKYPTIRKELVTDDGKYTFFSFLNPLESETDKLKVATTGFVMRKDWLENVGLDVPTNIDEWYEVLTAFKNSDPNNNGQQDEIPFDGTGLEMFAPAFGLRSTYYLDPETGKVKYGPIEPQFKEYLATLNKWYKEGLIGNNSIISDSKVTDNNITSDLAGSFKGLDNAWDKYLKTLQEKNPNADFVPVPWPATVDGKVYTDRTELQSHINKETTIITTSCEYPEVAATLIDYMYSDEGSFLLSWGIEGVNFDYVDGKPVFREYDGETDSLAAYVRPHLSLPKFGYVEAHIAAFSEQRITADRVWAQASSDLIIPKMISFTVEENNKIIDYSEGTDTQSMIAKFIMGEEPLSNFDAYVETMKKKHNVEEIIQIYQDALDRYNVR